MFITDQERAEFIKSKLGSIKKLTSLTNSYMTYMYDESELNVLECEEFTTDGYEPGVIVGVEETEEGCLLFKMIVNGEIRRMYMCSDIEEFIKDIKSRASNRVFEWSEEEITNYSFMIGKMVMFQALANTVIHFYAITNNYYPYVYEWMHTIEELCCKENT